MCVVQVTNRLMVRASLSADQASVFASFCLSIGNPFHCNISLGNPFLGNLSLSRSLGTHIPSNLLMRYWQLLLLELSVVLITCVLPSHRGRGDRDRVR